MDSLEAIESQRELALENDARGELRSLVFWAIPALIDKIRRTEAERERCLAVVEWVASGYLPPVGWAEKVRRAIEETE